MNNIQNKNKNKKSATTMALVSILLLSSISVITINNSNTSVYGLIITMKTGKKLDTGKSFDKKSAANATAYTKMLADKLMPSAKNATDYCITKGAIIGLFNNLCDSVVSLDLRTMSNRFCQRFLY